MKPFYNSKADLNKAGNVWFESWRQAYVMHGDEVGASYQSEDGEYWYRA